MSQGMVSFIQRSASNAGERKIAKAIEKMKLREEYFSAPAPVSYHDFIRRNSEPGAPEPLDQFPEIEGYAEEQARAGFPIAPTVLDEMRRFRSMVGPIEREIIQSLQSGFERLGARRAEEHRRTAETKTAPPSRPKRVSKRRSKR
jgi:hypothetical protein